MTQLLARGVVRTFRLTNEPGGLGLSCTPGGLSLAGVPLLRRTQTGFVPRSTSQVTSLLRAAYEEDPTRLRSTLDAIANALNRGDFAAAMIAAVHTLTPEMSPEAALRLANAEQELIKYNYNPYEPRDSHGRWTTDGVVGQANVGSPGIVSDQAVDVRVFDQRRVPDDPSSTDSALLSGGGDGSEGPTPLKQPVEGNYDNLGSVQVTMVDDIMRSIVKNACIAECSESSLPTHNYGWKFFNCANDCLRRHGTTHLPSVRSRGGWMEWRTGCQRTQPRS
jgi:hypothetical protein